MPQQHDIETAITAKLAAALQETEAKPIAELRYVVACLGGTACVALLQETLQIERQGGMLTRDKTRRRTRGGVFLHLAKKQIAATMGWERPADEDTPALYTAILVPRAGWGARSADTSNTGASSSASRRSA